MKSVVMKAISFILVTCMLLPVSVFASEAETSNSYTFVYDERTIEIDAAGITYEQAKLIADGIAYGNSEASTYGIFCIFGHDIATTYAKETTHKEYADSPRCVRRTYRVDYCTRSSCSYSEATLTSIVRLPCCD